MSFWLSLIVSAIDLEMQVHAKQQGFMLGQALLVILVITGIAAISIGMAKEGEYQAVAMKSGFEVREIAMRIRNYYSYSPDFQTPVLDTALVAAQGLAPQQMLAGGGNIRSASGSAVTVVSTPADFYVQLLVDGQLCPTIADKAYAAFYRVAARPDATGVELDIHNTLPGQVGRLSAASKAASCGPAGQLTRMRFYAQ